MNKIILSGRVTKDPIIKKSASGNDVALFAIAHNGVKRKDATNDTMFLDCSVVGKQAETVSKYVHKGDKLTVCGRLTQSTYTDKNGVRHTENSIFVEEFDLPEKPKSVEEQKEEIKKDTDLPW